MLEEQERIKKLEDLDNFLGGITAPQKESNPMDDLLSVKPVSVKSKAKMQATIRLQQQTVLRQPSVSPGPPLNGLPGLSNLGLP